MAVKRFDRAKRKLSGQKFDELNVIEVSRELYKELEHDNERAFLELAKAKYEDTEPRGEEKPDRKWLIALLAMYNPTTNYVYKNEVDRKRAYMVEGVASAVSKKPDVGNVQQAQNPIEPKPLPGAKNRQIRKALSYWSNFTAQYADIVEDESTLKAYKDGGVQYVQWHTQEDEKVCKECGPRDKQIYPIGEIPAKPHWHCRCWLTPISDNGKDPWDDKQHNGNDGGKTKDFNR